MPALTSLPSPERNPTRSTTAPERNIPITPHISIIIPIYNRAHIVSRTLESVRTQTFTAYEVIIVDDASTDELALTLENYLQDPRFRVVTLSQNKGAAGAKNAGIEQAKGEYIALLDSDDVWSPDKLEKQLAFLQSQPETVPLSFTGCWVQREDGQRLLRAPQKYGTWFASLLYGESFNPGATLLATRRCFSHVGLFDETLRRLEDHEWCLRYFQTFEDFAVLPEPLAIIYNSGWPRAAVVDAALTALFEKAQSIVQRRAPELFPIFHGSLLFESVVAHLRERHYARACHRLLNIALSTPRFLPHLWQRLRRKLSAE